MNKVRYLTIPRVSIELVGNLSEHENAQFIKIIFSCFRQLEDGQGLAYEETDSPILNIALREAVEELETGYKNYIQRMNARKKPSPDPKESEPESPKDQRSIGGQSEMDHRPTIDQNQSDQNQSGRSDNINQIRSNLIQSGYTNSEINEIISRTDLSQIHNPELYIKTSIDRERKKPKKILSAQRYEQRDYHTTEAEQAKYADDLLDSLDSLMEKGG